jgi:predicted transcriptional regulator
MVVALALMVLKFLVQIFCNISHFDLDINPSGSLLFDQNQGVLGGSLNLLNNAVFSGHNWIISNCVATSGGGIYSDSSNFTVSNMTLSNNTANIEGTLLY